MKGIGLAQLLNLVRYALSYKLNGVQICKKRRRLGCVNPANWHPLDAGSEFTQPSFHLFFAILYVCDDDARARAVRWAVWAIVRVPFYTSTMSGVGSIHHAG